MPKFFYPPCKTVLVFVNRRMRMATNIRQRMFQKVIVKQDTLGVSSIMKEIGEMLQVIFS